jgi:hypothetical protein
LSRVSAQSVEDVALVYTDLVCGSGGGLQRERERRK